MKNKFLTVVLFIILGLTMACDETIEPADQTALTEQEITDLKFLREEEKLAFDVYRYAYDKYALAIFNNISQSELSHTNAVLAILDMYSLEDPVGNNAQGVFVNEQLQQLYNDFISQVDKSEQEALYVGATIEDLDINDLANMELQTENDDLKTLYRNLVCGSRNHLRSFVSWLDVDYSPVYITQAEYEEIINSNRQQCSTQ